MTYTPSAQSPSVRFAAPPNHCPQTAALLGRAEGGPHKVQGQSLKPDSAAKLSGSTKLSRKATPILSGPSLPLLRNLPVATARPMSRPLRAAPPSSIRPPIPSLTTTSLPFVTTGPDGIVHPACLRLWRFQQPNHRCSTHTRHLAHRRHWRYGDDPFGSYLGYCPQEAVATSQPLGWCFRSAPLVVLQCAVQGLGALFLRP